VLDLRITGGQLLDGTGRACFSSRCRITGDSIIALGDLSREPAGQTVDATGLTVARLHRHALTFGLAPCSPIAVPNRRSARG